MQELIWLVDDDTAQRQLEDHALQHRLRYRTRVMGVQETIHALRQRNGLKPDLMLIHVARNQTFCLEAIRLVRQAGEMLPVVALVGYGEQDNALKALEAGANDFLVKPLSIERLRLSLQLALKVRRMSHYIGWLERRMARHVDFSDMVGTSPGFREALADARLAASSRAPGCRKR